MWEITKPAIVRAGRDIVDLPFFGQNLAPTDVTQVLAGRDIYYTDNIGKSTFAGPAPGNNPALSLAGPGFFDIEAGRSLGPFVTPAAIRASQLLSSARNPTGTGIITFGDTVVVGNRQMLSDKRPDLVTRNQYAIGANALLDHRGAEILARFGVANGVDYQAVIDAYVSPAASSSASYLPALSSFLQTLDPRFGALSPADAWAAFNNDLPPARQVAVITTALRQIFAQWVLFRELYATGDASGCCFQQYDVGYAAIAKIFPIALGYSDPFGDKDARKHTGDLEMLHATIKTLQSAVVTVQNNSGGVEKIVGGNVMVLGPGGGINVGTTAVELDTRLTNSAVGILTLDNGTISTFTDGDVLVNQSRILTVQGGDIVMWSTRGDLDAGRGAKTTLDYKPLAVNFNPQDLQTIDLNGLVSGAGIGTIKSTPDAPEANATLLAPQGTINAGDAGLRSSGAITLVGQQILNAANISASGPVSGVPQVATTDLAALSSISTSAGQAGSGANEAVAAAAQRGQPQISPQLPSIITVEVLGFGGP
jgi:hypothetical protein